MKKLIALIFMTMILAGCNSSGFTIINETDKTYFITNKVKIYSRYQAAPNRYYYHISDGENKLCLYSANDTYEVGDIVRITIEPRVSKVVK